MNKVYQLMDRLHLAVVSLPNYEELRLRVYYNDLTSRLDRKVLSLTRREMKQLSKLAKQLGVE